MQPDPKESGQQDDSDTAGSMTRTLHPEVVLLGDHAMSCIRWTLERETERMDYLFENTPTIRSVMEQNGWTTRMLALGHIVSGLIDLADFDDEGGRTGMTCSCGGGGWVDDENWSPEFAGQQRVRRDGLIPCGFCNEDGARG